MDTEEGVMAGFLGLGCLGSLIGFAVHIAFWIAIIWGIIELVQYVTT